MEILVVLISVLSFCNIAELRPTISLQNRRQLDFEFNPFRHTNETCNMTVDTLIIDRTNNYFEDRADLVLFNIEIIGYSRQDSDRDGENNINQLQLILTNSPTGKALLMLPGRAIPMSLYTLSHGIHELAVKLQQKPDDCIGRTNVTDTIAELQELLGQAILTIFGSQDSKLSADIEVCHSNTIDSELIYQCCTIGLDGLKICEQVKVSSKMIVLLTMINILLSIVMLYSPVLIPPSLYLWHTSETYTIQLPQAENRITFDTNLKVDPDLKIDLQNLGKTARGIKIQVNQDKIVSKDDKPVGLFSCLWHFCKTSESVTACTNAPLFPFCKTTDDDQKNSCCKTSFRTIVSRCIRFLGSISPLIVIILFNELTKQKQMIASPSVNNTTIYVTPIVWFLLGSLILTTLLSLCTPKIVKKRVITVVLEDMKKSMTSGFSRFVALVSSSFQKLGVCFALTLLPITIIMFSPILLTMFPLLRLYYLLLTTAFRLGKMNKQIWKVLNQNESKRIRICVLVIMLNVSIVYYVSFVCLNFYVNCIVYTIIGVIINSDFYKQYVTFFTIIALYGFYNFIKVSEVFINFNKTVQAYIQKRFSNELNYTEPGANSGMVMEIGDKTIEFKTDAFGRLVCLIPGLVLLHSSNRTQQIPKRFLSHLTKDIHNQFPDKPQVLYGRAFINLVFITIFIASVFQVVYAFGRSNGITSAGKLIFAVFGSILPFLIRGVLFKIETEEKPDTDSESWKDAFDKVLENYIHIETWVIDQFSLEDRNENVASTRLIDNESTPPLREGTVITLD